MNSKNTQSNYQEQAIPAELLRKPWLCRELHAQVTKKHKNWLRTILAYEVMDIIINRSNFAEYFPMSNFTEEQYTGAYVGMCWAMSAWREKSPREHAARAFVEKD